MYVEYIAQLVEQFTFNEKVEGSIPSALKVARRVNINAYRLGHAAWWLTRTPPSLKRDISLFLTEATINGIFKKFKFLISDLIIQRKFDRSGFIMIFGRHLKAPWSNKKLFKAKFKKYYRLICYLLHYLYFFFNQYFFLNYKLCFRESNRFYFHSKILWHFFAFNNTPLLNFMRRTHKKFKVFLG